MGVVYAANDLSDGRRVAIKVLDSELADDRAFARMRSEAAIGKCVSHPAVVAVLDSGSVDGLPYVAMEYVAGAPLHHLIVTEGELPLRRALQIIAQVLAGLEAIHAAGFVHGDMKTDNILIAQLDDIDRVKIIDLGLAHSRSEHGDGRNLSGTPEYMAPEVISGEGATIRSDIYSVGVILYELITGAPPFCDDSAEEIMRRHVEDDVVPPSLRAPSRAIPPALEQAVMRALARRPADRFTSAKQLARALARIHMSEEQATATARLPVISTSAPTLEWTQKGLETTADSPAVARARQQVSIVLEKGDRDAITVAALELAQVLLAEHRLAAAAKELESTIAALSVGRELAIEPGPMWRLLLSLAAIYDGLGYAERARATAQVALLQASAAQSSIGRSRARALVERLTARGRMDCGSRA
jgi:serine/threonine protein kinase